MISTVFTVVITVALAFSIFQAEARQCFNSSELANLNSDRVRIESSSKTESILDSISTEEDLQKHIQDCRPNGTTTTTDAVENLRRLSEFSLVTSSSQSSVLIQKERFENLKIIGQCEDLPKVILTTTPAPPTTPAAPTKRPCVRCPRPTTPKSSEEDKPTVTPRPAQPTETTPAPSTTPGQTTVPCPPQCKNLICPRCRHCKVSTKGKAFCAKDDDFHACKKRQLSKGAKGKKGNNGSNGSGKGGK